MSDLSPDRPTSPYVVKHQRPCICTEADDPNDHRKDCPHWRSGDPLTGEGEGVVSVKAFETLEEVRAHASRLLSRWRDADGMPKVWGERWTTWNRLHALACSKPENGGAFTAEGGKVELPDGSEIVVEATTGEALYWATPAEARPMPDDSLTQRLSAIVVAYNRAMAERYGTEAPHARHFMLPGSHERPDGPECRCGAAWSRWDNCCARTAEDGT